MVAAAAGAAARVPPAAQRRLSVDVRRGRRPDDRQDGRRHPRHSGATRAAASERVTFGQAVVRAAACLVSVLPAGLGFCRRSSAEDRRACTIGSPTRASSKRDPPRRLHRDRRLLRLFPDRARHGRLRRGTRRLPARLVDAVAVVEVGLIVVTFAVGVWAATTAERYFGGIDPGPSSSTKSSACWSRWRSSRSAGRPRSPASSCSASST